MSVSFSVRRDISKQKWDIQMHSTRVPAPCGQSGTWKAIYLLVQFSKSCCVESFPLICGSGVILGVHKQPYLVIFLRPSLSRISLVLSRSWGSPVGSEGWEGFVHPVLKGVSLDSTQIWGQAAGRQGRGKINKGSPCRLGQQVVSLERKEWKSLSRVWLFATPWTIQSMESPGPESWSGEPFPSPGDLPNPGIKPRSPALRADSFQLRDHRVA